MALGLGLFALAMVIAVVLGAIAARNSRDFDESKHVNMVTIALQKNGKKGA